MTFDVSRHPLEWQSKHSELRHSSAAVLSQSASGNPARVPSTPTPLHDTSESSQRHLSHRVSNQLNALRAAQQALFLSELNSFPAAGSGSNSGSNDSSNTNAANANANGSTSPTGTGTGGLNQSASNGFAQNYSRLFGSFKSLDDSLDAQTRHFEAICQQMENINRLTQQQQQQQHQHQSHTATATANAAKTGSAAAINSKPNANVNMNVNASSRHHSSRSQPTHNRSNTHAHAVHRSEYQDDTKYSGR